MSAPLPLRVAVLGYGGMGKAHAYAYRTAPFIRPLPCQPVLQVIAGRQPESLERAARAYGFAEWSTDWRATVERPDVDLVDVCTPPGAHAEQVEAAARAGKAILCEKPLAIDLAAGTRALEAVRRAGVPNAIGFNYRRLPALALMKRMIDDGAVGEPRLWRGRWLTDEFVDPSIPYDWRFDRRVGGTSVADLGAHLLDFALWMVGDVEAVSGQMETFVRERADPAGGPPVAVTVDDAASALLRFANGARGSFEISRASPRRPCDMAVEVNGTRGTLFFDYARLNELWYGDAQDASDLYGLRRIRAEHPSHPYAPQWWPLGQGVGFGSSFVNQACDLLERWPDGPWAPDLAHGLKVQAVCEAIERSALERRWVALDELHEPT
jgi:predicted dehydrogenase